MKGKVKDRERLLRIISLCLAVERKGNPFEVEVQKVLTTLRKYLPHWKSLEDFVLDSKTLYRISSIVRLQGRWIKHRSSTLYVDPLMIELKIRMMDPQKLANIFGKSWHPIVVMDRLSARRINEAINYWNQLLPLKERLLKLPEPSSELGSINIEELIKSRIYSEESFNDLLQQMWLELKIKAEEEKISYWNFIYAETYEDTIFRAYLTSFLLTYGYADMKIDPIEEESFLLPCKKPQDISLKEPMVSIPISIDYDHWKEIAKRKRD